MTGTIEETTTRTLAMPPTPRTIPATVNGCGGWQDETGHWHRCATQHDKLYAQERCVRCYNRQRRVVKEAQRVAREDVPRGLGPDDFGGEDAPHAPAAETLRSAAVATIERETPSLTESQNSTPAGHPSSSIDPRHTVAAPAAPDGYDWTLFDAPPGVIRDSSAPMVTLGKDGDIRLNFGAFDLLGSPVAIEVLHDERRRALALRAVAPDKPHARVLREDRKTRARQIAARPLRRLLPWVPVETLRLTPRLAGGLLILDIPR